MAADDWTRDGEWGIDGACVSTRWSLSQLEGGEEVDGYVTVEIEPDHADLIRRAIATATTPGPPCCGFDPDDHDWNLDRKNAEDVLAAIREARASGTTVITVTHDEQTARREASRLVGLRDGRVATEDRP